MLINHRLAARRRCRSHSSRGFSLLEVMVALVVLSVGLLGVLKLEAAAVSSTTIASQRSLAAIEAASLAAVMHANRGYWANSDPSGAVITITNSTVVVTAGAPILATSVAGNVACNVAGAPCAVADMASYDLKQWATKAMVPLLKNYVATLSCGVVSPVSCILNIQWTENAVAINTQEAAQQAASPNLAFSNPSYTLYIEP